MNFNREMTAKETICEYYCWKMEPAVPEYGSALKK